MRHPNLDEKIAAVMAQAQADQTQLSRGSHKASCSTKDRYISEATAKAVALMNGTAPKLLTYQCEHCHGWHLARRHKSR